jgi:hypothetical protein
LHLTDYHVRTLNSSQEPDLAEVWAALAAPRPSLSLSQFSDDDFKKFRTRMNSAKDEADVLASVLPIILGHSTSRHYCARNTMFTNLEPLTDDSIASPMPDIYYGAYPEKLARGARNELSSHIVPSTMEDKPMVPNCFVECKGNNGSGAVALRQACYDGAIGSRAMHSLQNYGLEEPKHDGKPYTFSSTLHLGTLKIYAHHVTAPNKDGGRPEYHMSHIRSYAMDNDRDTFVEGAKALRNIRDLAKKYRDQFIDAANIRVEQHEDA